MIILDTNIISELMQAPLGPVASWIDTQHRSSLWTTSITVFEIRFGLLIMPPGKRQAGLARFFEGFLEGIDHQVVPFDFSAADYAADLHAKRKQRGSVGELRDTLIAGIVLARRATLATRNTRHFADLNVPVVNPWTT